MCRVTVRSESAPGVTMQSDRAQLQREGAEQEGPPPALPSCVWEDPSLDQEAISHWAPECE